MSDPINDAITQAQEAAANAVAPAAAAAAASVPAVTSGNTPAPALGNSLADFDTSGLDVDGFIKPTPYGLLVPKENEDPVKDPVRVKIDLGECVRHLAIKANRGKTVKYWKTYDGVTSVPTGESWQKAIADARALSGKEDLEPYQSVDIPMTLLQDAGGAEAGTTLGYSLSTTNQKAFKQFLRAVKRAGLPVDSGEVVVDLGSEKMTSDSYTWAVVTFDFVERYVEQ